MTQIEHVSSTAPASDIIEEFKSDILSGFSKKNKSLPSKYFYDDIGSALFNQITTHPDYYPTNCELEILNSAKHKILHLFESNPFHLIELGPGEGIKTKMFIEHCLLKNMNVTYIPIDISSHYLEELVEKLDKQVPSMRMLPIHADYFDGIKWVNLDSSERNLVLFLGSSIGNFTMTEAEEFLVHLRENLHENDHVLIGLDLRKNIDVLMRAYNDSAGITREFNLNILRRMNNTLGANFDVNKFKHHATYNFTHGAMESYLVSVEKQLVAINALETIFSFDAFEAIHLEYSYKYTLTQIEALAKRAGFTIIDHFFDKKNYFVDSLWQV